MFAKEKIAASYESTQIGMLRIQAQRCDAK